MIWELPLYFCVYKSVAHGACGETAEEQQQLIILKFTQHQYQHSAQVAFADVLS